MVANPGKNAVYGMKNRVYRVSRGGMRPTSASCIITDEYGDKKLVGKCHRAEWFRLNGVAATNPPNDRSWKSLLPEMVWKITSKRFGKTKAF